jgi:DNA replication protein DnaC
MSKTETKSTVLLKHHLKALKLPTILAEAEKIAQRCAADNADHLAFLLHLVELELIERERKAAERRLKAARFPATKLLVPPSNAVVGSRGVCGAASGR